MRSNEFNTAVKCWISGRNNLLKLSLQINILRLERISYR